MDIDLDAIFYKECTAYPFSGDISKQEALDCMMEAVHQALVLASEKAKNAISTDPNSDLGIKKKVEQSILDVDKLIKT